MYEVPYGEDGGSGDIDKMRLALSKQNKPAPTPPSLSSQIPGYGKPVPPAQTPPDPLGAAAGNFTELATKYNPLMMLKSMQEAVRTLNPAIPVAGAWADVAQNIQTAGAEAMYDILGNRKGIEKMQQNYVPVTTGRFYQAPTTPVGKEFESDVIKAMDASKMPAMWPVALNQPIRPPITPNDVRVMGAEATRMGRQIKDIPTDFVNAQSGMQRLDPITGQPTYGAKLQGVADSVGDIMAQREMQGLPPIPGLPASMQPTNPKLYAMRPAGSRVTSATLPATATSDAATYMPAQAIINNVIGDATITPVQALDEIQNNILRKPEAASARRAFESFLKQKANEMYPDAPSESAALSAYKARFGNREASAAHSLEMYDEFLNTPNGVQYRAALSLPSAEELPARHEAASNWLNSQFTNYLIEKVGTPNEPAAKLASQGLTFYPPSDVFDLVTTSSDKIGAKRTAAGMPAKTPTDEALTAADQQLTNLVQQAGDAATRKREQEAIAQQLGYGAVDPNTGVVPEGMNLGRYEPFAQASRESNKANVAYRKQQQVVDNLRLGTAYEYATDTAIHAPIAKDLKEEIEYSERQFYPALMQTPDTERAYIANPVQLRNLGFEDLAKSFYNDVMSGKIKLDKVPKMTVEKYIRDTAEGRIAAEKLAQVKEKQFKADADNQFARTAALYIPNDKVFGNVGALEITNRFTPEQVAQLVSEDTLALDVCIGEGGNVSDKPNLWHPGTGNRQYIPIYNIVTGQRDPDATSPRGAYINAVATGSQMVSFRDTVTGEPVAIFDFNPSSTGKYDINFASGRKNKEVKPEYVEGIKSYLNSREDSIRGVSDKMNENLGIYDSKRMSNSALASVVNMPVSRFKKYDLSNLPRFVTSSDIRNYVEELKATEPQAPVPAVMSQRPSESLEAYTTGAVASAIDNVLDSQRRAFEEAGEGDRFAVAETFFTQTREAFNAYQRTQNPVQALISTKQRLYDLESEYANSNRVSANIIADGIVDLIRDFQEHINYAMARQAAEAGQQQPRAVTVGQNGRPQYLRMTHDAFMQLERDFGEEAANEMRSAVRSIIEQQGIDPQISTDPFITALRVAAHASPLGTVDIALSNLANEMESAYMRDWEPEVAPQPPARQPQAFDFENYVDTAAEELRILSDPLSRRYASIARNVAQQYNPLVDPVGYATALRAASADVPHSTIMRELNRLADDVEYALRDLQQPAPVNQLAEGFDFAGVVNMLGDDLSREFGDNVGAQFRSIATRVADEVNPQTNPTEYANRLRAVDPAYGAFNEAIRLELRRLALAIEAAPAQPRAADFANMQNDRMIEVENMLNDPDSSPEDLRRMANGVGNPLTQDVNNYWLSLAEEDRRSLSQQLHQRANYIEFNPNTFARRLTTETGLNIPELRDTVQALNDGVFDHEVLRGLPDYEVGRAAQLTALELERIIQVAEGNTNGMPAAPVDVTPAVRNDAYDIATTLDESYYQGADSPQQALAMVDYHLSLLRDSPTAAFDAILNRDVRTLATGETFTYSPALIQALIVELELIYTTYRDRIVGGNANGGPVRGYQKGGTVKKPDVPTPYLFSVPTYSETVAYEMYPGQLGQNDQRDAARHMLAAGTLSRKYGPKTAEFLGKAHEFTTSPLQSVKSMFTGKMPADYDMDTHNNRFGAQLGQRAKSQAELEDLVQEEAERASRTQTQDKAFIKKANGGIVQQNPTTDQMRYALTMRRK